MCLAAVSYKRLELLRRTFSAVVEHLETSEPTLRYEIAWVDNGSDEGELEQLGSDIQVEHKVWNAENVGLGGALNTIYNDLCTAPYVLTLEEDWLYNPGPLPLLTSRPLAEAIALLREDADAMQEGALPQHGQVYARLPKERPILGVVLRPETFDQFIPTPVMMHEYIGGVDGTISRYRRYCMNTASGTVWGSYTNGAAVYDRARLLSLGRMHGQPGDGFLDQYSEANFAFRAGRAFCTAVPILRKGCHDATGCNAIFEHIGGGAKSTGHSHISKKDHANHAKWIFYGTGLHSQADDA